MYVEDLTSEEFHRCRLRSFRRPISAQDRWGGGCSAEREATTGGETKRRGERSCDYNQKERFVRVGEEQRRERQWHEEEEKAHRL